MLMGFFMLILEISCIIEDGTVDTAVDPCEKDDRRSMKLPFTVGCWIKLLRSGYLPILGISISYQAICMIDHCAVRLTIPYFIPQIAEM